MSQQIDLRVCVQECVIVVVLQLRRKNDINTKKWVVVYFCVISKKISKNTFRTKQFQKTEFCPIIFFQSFFKIFFYCYKLLCCNFCLVSFDWTCRFLLFLCLLFLTLLCAIFLLSFNVGLRYDVLFVILPCRIKPQVRFICTEILHRTLPLVNRITKQYNLFNGYRPLLY